MFTFYPRYYSLCKCNGSGAVAQSLVPACYRSYYTALPNYTVGNSPGIAPHNNSTVAM